MFYAVGKGKIPGVYKSWNECLAQVKGFKGGAFRKFKIKAAAEDFVRQHNPRNKSGLTNQSKISNFFKIIPNSEKKPIHHKVSKNKIEKMAKIDKPSGVFIPDYYVYTDGACSNNGRKNAKAGLGIYFGENDSRNKSARVHHWRQTNNTAELLAIIKTYKIIKPDLDLGKKVCIASDSQYSINCATKYGEKMAKNNWIKDIPNKKLVKKIYELYGTNKDVIFKHVRAHTQNTDVHSIGNDNADRLANEAIGLTNCPYSKTKIYLAVLHSEKDIIKNFGGKWDKKNKSWYIYEDNKNKKTILDTFQISDSY